MINSRKKQFLLYRNSHGRIEFDQNKRNKNFKFTKNNVEESITFSKTFSNSLFKLLDRADNVFNFVRQYIFQAFWPEKISNN